MRTYIDPRIDRTGWGPGPWQDEPDKVEWKDEATGLPCLAKRNTYGNWCGYVGVPPGHIAYEQDYNNVDVSCHGGLTYADHCQEGPVEQTICHIPEPGQPDKVWWLGFDCAHAWDQSPSPLMRMWSSESIYRTLDYVRENCTRLAAQLAALTSIKETRDEH